MTERHPIDEGFGCRLTCRHHGLLGRRLVVEPVLAPLRRGVVMEETLKLIRRIAQSVIAGIDQWLAQESHGGINEHHN